MKSVLRSFILMVIFAGLNVPQSSAQRIEFRKKNLDHFGKIIMPESWDVIHQNDNLIEIRSKEHQVDIKLERIPMSSYPNGDSLCREFASQMNIPMFVRRISGETLDYSKADEGFYSNGTVLLNPEQNPGDIGDKPSNVPSDTPNHSSDYEEKLNQMPVERLAPGETPRPKPAAYHMIVVYERKGFYWVMKATTTLLPLSPDLLWQSHRKWKLK